MKGKLLYNTWAQLLAWILPAGQGLQAAGEEESG